MLGTKLWSANSFKNEDISELKVDSRGLLRQAGDGMRSP